MLTPMSPTDIDAFLAESVESYSGELKQARKTDVNEARAIAREQLREILPRGGETAGDEFCWVVDEELQVGRVRYGVGDEDDLLYVYDLEIDGDRRGRGYGARVLDEIIAEARRLGVAAMGLSVFEDNPTARALYARRGFGAIGSVGGQTEMRLDL